MIPLGSKPPPRKRRPDLFGLAASGFLAAFFSFYFFVFSSALCRAGSLLVILSAGGIFLKLWFGKPAIAQNGSIRSEIEHLRQQLAALRRTLFFAILPLLVGLNLFCFGLPRPGLYKYIFLTATILICLAVFWISQRRLRASIRQLESEVANFPK